MLRDQVITTSIEQGVGAMQQDTAPTGALRPGYALPTPPVASGTEEQRLRNLVDECFLHLSATQRDAVFDGVQKILNDPKQYHNKASIVAEFTLKARAVREAYRSMDRLSQTEKQTLAVLAKEEFRRLPTVERRQMLELLQSGVLPMPRDLNAIMLAELNSVAAATGGRLRPD